VNYELIKGDCIEQMKAMKPETFDLTVTSPPYDNLRTYEGSLQWNEEIWKQVLEQLYRVTKRGGVVVWVVGDATVKGSETGTSFKQALYAKEVGFNLHDTMVYRKETPTWNISSKRYRQHTEYMFVLSKGKVATFNPIEDQKVKNLKPRMCKSNRNGKPKYELYIPKKEYTCRGNIWNYAVGGRGPNHPAIFPEALASDHIKSWSNEGDVVFDPFMGSGTTGKMAVQLNRKFVGVEKVDEYYSIAKERLVTARSLQLELEVTE
tara:strand:+ start:195 stop:983 length:789 start_codon:yes stop_codon:yes gene_type:complete